LRNFDAEIRQTLRFALAADVLRIERAEPRPWPFIDWPFPETPVPPHLDVPSPGEQNDFIAIILVDLDGNAVKGARYQITLPSGTTREGLLDSEGKARLDGLDPGSCRIVFPDFDATDFA
jgi:hypothetical protein